MLRVLTAGESHGPELVAVMEGLPAGVPVSRAASSATAAARA
jgi:chorismate synthase